MVEAGGHGLLTFRRQDLIVVSPGVPLSTPELKQVRAMGMPIIGELELGSRFLRARWWRSPGRTARRPRRRLLGKIFDGRGRADAGRAATSGLPRDRSWCARAHAETRWNVLEVSSFQLETIETFRPRIALVLNITPDHLDRHGDFEN